MRKAISGDVIFDLKNYGNDVNFKLFEVERSSDLLVASFNSNELQNGTYTTWLAGANGHLLRWKDGVSGLEMKGSKLVGNGANPCFLTPNYIADPTQTAGMYVVGNFDVPMLTGTYCVSLIHDQEYNTNNQNINLGITGNDGGFFMFQWRGTGGFNGGKHFFKTTNIGNYTSDGHVNNTNPNFKIVVYKIVDSYVTDILINGVSLIHDQEYNTNNQNINLGITGNDGGFFMFQWRGTGGFNGGKHFFKTTNIGNFTSDGHANNTNPNFKIVVYKIVNSYVTDVLINGVGLTIDRTATAFAIGSESMPSKSIYLGAKLIDLASKISNYKEIGYHKDGDPAVISASLNAIHSIY